MRRFHSYGPVDCKRHFCIPRKSLVEQCINNPVGDPDEAGHYFTIWAPRQTGKTWLMRQVLKEIPKRYEDRRKALFREPNNTLMNLIAKARKPEYQPFLLELFSRADMPFSFHKPLHNYLYLHGILDADVITTPKGEEEICRFSCPFVQQCLYQALGIVSTKSRFLMR